MSENNQKKNNRKSKFEVAPIDLGQLFEKSPPVNLQAERVLLGALILEPSKMADVMYEIKDGMDFHLPRHQILYDVILRLYDANPAGVDEVLINNTLTSEGKIEEIGGVEYLAELAEGVPTPELALSYAKIVHEKALMRRLIEAAGKILDACYNTSGAPASELLDMAGKVVFDLQEGRGSQSMGEISTIAEQLMDVIANRTESMTGLASGFTEMDEMTNGLHVGELIIMAARPSMGKTAFMLNVAENIAINTHIPVGIFSLEMGKEQLVQRMLCSRACVDSQKLRKNKLSPDDMNQLSHAAGMYYDATILIDDTPGLSLTKMRSRARRMVSEHGVKAIFVDYLQLMSEPGFSSRQEEVGYISRGLKGLARELNVPLICLAQLNRGVEDRPGASRRPRMSDLRESGSIEQDADIVALIHREAYYHKGDEAWLEENAGKENEAEIIIDKQRNGPTGVVRLVFDGATTSFRDPAYSYQVE